MLLWCVTYCHHHLLYDCYDGNKYWIGIELVKSWLRIQIWSFFKLQGIYECVYESHMKPFLRQINGKLGSQSFQIWWPLAKQGRTDRVLHSSQDLLFNALIISWHQQNHSIYRIILLDNMFIKSLILTNSNTTRLHACSFCQVYIFKSLANRTNYII